MISSSRAMKIVPVLRQSVATRMMATLSASVQNYATTKISKENWSNQLSFASPESDFVSASAQEAISRQISTSSVATWSNSMSFASPESDFTGANVGAQGNRQLSTSTSESWTNQLSFASPESDFVGQLVSDAIADQQRERSRLVQADSSSSFLSSLVSTLVGGTPHQPVHSVGNVPKTFKEALTRYHEAIVVTTATAPHTILYVNKAWEDMCGYKSSEVLDKTLNCIQGPKTNVSLAASSVKKLLNEDTKHQEPIDMYLVNYRKDGTSFTNHVTLGTMTLDDTTDERDFLVGVLEEVSPDEVPLRMVL